MSEPTKTIRVSGAIVLIQLEDGAIRQAHLDQVEHMRTVINVCMLNEEHKLKLGQTDFSEVLTPYLEQQNEEENAEDDSE